ncbi:MAG TPA: NfeD family protein [Spirochaetota bacterium]|nr:NfeD family protein [Spirochaetota bacterium]HPJ38089.1 NfeD family protein [Spirochaetota bacterium]HPQ51877.1 NfeD family protein [Spirochaetota bacterium]
MAFSPFIWLAVGILIMGMEILVPGFVLFWFGIGGVVTSLLVFIKIIPEQNAVAQWVSFFLTSLLCLSLWHFYAGKYFKKSLTDETGDPTLQNLTGRVVKPVMPGVPGEVELYSGFHGIKKWQAEAKEVLEEGEEVRVLEARGIKLVVEKK